MTEPFISKITLRNFKRFKELTFELKQGVNILYGTNGTGKTSILEAINIASGSFFMDMSSVEKRLIKLSDIRLAAHNDNGLPLPEYQFPVSIEAKGCVLGKKISWRRTLNSVSSGTTMIEAKAMSIQSQKASALTQNGEREVLPIVAYFSTQRLFGERKATRVDSTKKPVGRFSGYYNSLNSTNTQKHIKAAFKDAEYEQYQIQQTDKTFVNEGLESMKALLLRHFEDWERIYYFDSESNPNVEKGLYIAQKDGNIIPESLLSDGYRNFLWLLLDIAWRCYTLNPFLGKDAFAKTKGIVTIDEIDLHLHPKWQQRVLSILATEFPNIQFVITTHSPIIMSSVKGSVLMLEDDTITYQENIYGMKPSYVLEVLMHIQERLPHFQENIHTYFTLINEGNGKSAEALAIRKQLEADISQNEPMFTEADALIDFLSY